MKTLVVYYYKEEYDTITNLAFFLKHGVIHSSNYYYAFLINNMVCSLNIEETSTVKIFKRSENEYDLPTYKWFFQNMLKESPTYFDQFGTFYFLNSSCVGPFVPTIIELNWIELFNKKLEKYDLVAPIVEFPPDSRGFEMLGLESSLNVPFLHSYMFGTNSSSVHLLKKVLLGIDNLELSNGINYERILTSEYLIHGKKIHSLLIAFHQVDINDSSIWNYKLWNKTFYTCYEIPENYFGIDINPLEVIFIKNIRKINGIHNIYSSGISRFLYTILNNYISWY